MAINDIFDESQLQSAPNEFDPAADLDELMVQSGLNPAYRPEFFRRLLQSPLWMMVEQEPDPEDIIGGYAGLIPLQFPDGYIPLFTSLARMQETPALLDYPRTSIKGRDLLEALEGKDCLLNPFSEPNLQLTAAFCQRLLSGENLGRAEIVELDHDRSLTVSTPDEYPAEMVAAVNLFLSGQPRVKAAYMVYVLASEEDPAHFVICIDAEGKIKSIAEELGLVTRSFITKLRTGVAIEQVLPNTGDFMEYVVSTPPIYLRA